MAASHQSIEEMLDSTVTETPQGKGLTMTFKVTVYDNGLINVNGRPVTKPDQEGMIPGGAVEGWLAAGSIYGDALRLFARRVRARRDAQSRAA